MKKMIYLFILVFSLSTLVACSDDEGTPVFTEPTEFVLNVPKYASGIYDLKNTATIQLTCSQPDYGFTAATRYTVEIALDQAFEKNATLDTKYSTAKMEVDAQEVAVAISNLLGVNEDEFPKAPIPLYVRLTASALTDNKSEIAGSTITSNIIELPQVLPYYALPAVTLPTNLYLIGSVCDWDWSKCYSMIPVHSNEGMFWSMQYLGADADGNKAAFKLNTATSWDNNQVGIQGVTISEASKKLVDAGGEDNIEIGNPGWTPHPNSALPPRDLTSTLALKLFRREPAISGFDWNFSATHSSSATISTGVGSVLHKVLPLLQPDHG